MLTFTQLLSNSTDTLISFTLSLTADERTRTRHRFETPDGEDLYLRLPRGTILQEGNLLRAASSSASLSQIGEVVIRIAAKPEAVLTVTAQKPLDLLRAAYHLGNRHIPLEITPNYLRLSPDPVLQGMLEQLGLDVKSEILPFHPEIGAYGHNH